MTYSPLLSYYAFSSTDRHVASCPYPFVSRHFHPHPPPLLFPIFSISSPYSLDALSISTPQLPRTRDPVVDVPQHLFGKSQRSTDDSVQHSRRD